METVKGCEYLLKALYASAGLGQKYAPPWNELLQPTKPYFHHQPLYPLDVPIVLQELQGADAAVGREPAGMQRGLQGEAAQEEGAQAENHPHGRRGHRSGPAEQGADRAVAQGIGTGDGETIGGGLESDCIVVTTVFE